jgi:hypothetical protein
MQYNGVNTGTVYNYQSEKNNQVAFLYRDTGYGEYTYWPDTMAAQREMLNSFNGSFYTRFPSMAPTTTKVVIKDYHEYLYFSKDYKRINIRVFNGATKTSGSEFATPGYTSFTTPGKAAYWDKSIKVYEQSAPPQPPKPEPKPEPKPGSDGPDVFY